MRPYWWPKKLISAQPRISAPSSLKENNLYEVRAVENTHTENVRQKKNMRKRPPEKRPKIK